MFKQIKRVLSLPNRVKELEADVTNDVKTIISLRQDVSYFKTRCERLEHLITDVFDTYNVSKEDRIKYKEIFGID